MVRISRWIDEEEERTQGKGEMGVQYVVLDMGGELSPFV
jgi:sulfate transporter 3